LYEPVSKYVIYFDFNFISLFLFQMPGITRNPRKSKLVAVQNLSKINYSQTDSSMDETMAMDPAAAAAAAAAELSVSAM
jgi:hypothetical protein